MSDAVVETIDLTMRFGGVTAVDRVNFALQERELRCLIGPNGAGKSTFFKCLTGQYRLNSANGRVFIRGADVVGMRPHEIVRMGVGIKTQVPSVMNGLTVMENLWLAARRAHGWTRATAEVQRVIDEVGLARYRPPYRGRARPRPAADGRDRHRARAGPVAGPARRAGGRHHRRGGREAW